MRTEVVLFEKENFVNLVAGMKFIPTFATSYFSQKGGVSAEHILCCGIFCALTLLLQYNGFVPPCYSLMAITAFLWCRTKGQAEPFSFCLPQQTML